MLPNWPGYDLFGQSPTMSSTEEYGWSTDQQSLSMSVIGCDEGCTSHSNEVHEAIRTLQACRSPIHNQWASSNWTLGYSAWSLAPAMYPEPGGISWPVADPDQVLVQVPVTQPMGDAELLMICKFLSRGDVSKYVD
jgi:hypothetical protein